ncbi:MAG: helix-turn-helix domain-containing protein [Leptospirales bacterium]
MASFEYLALPSAFLLLVFAAGELAVRGIRKRNIVLALIFAGYALILARAWLLFSGWMLSAPFLYETTLPLNFWIGPLTFYYIRAAVGARSSGFDAPPARGAASIMRGFHLHLVPGLLVLLILIPNLFEAGHERIERIRAVMSYLHEAGEAPRDPYVLLLPLGIVHAAIYLGLIMRDMLLLLSVKSLRNESTVRAFLLIAAIALLSSTVAIGGFLTARPDWMRFSIGLLSTIAPLLYILQRRYPSFFNELESLLQKERERVRYQRSQLEGVNLENLERRLTELMDGERVYVRDDLSLPGLAEMLDTTPHQLSEYFNHIRNVNFAGYVNGRRVEAAQRLLLLDQDRTVLSIAYEVGFNSKSAFNEAFAKHAGLSPTRFRKSAGRPGL